jgi:hypothetical protein
MKDDIIGFIAGIILTCVVAYMLRIIDNPDVTGIFNLNNIHNPSDLVIRIDVVVFLLAFSSLALIELIAIIRGVARGSHTHLNIGGILFIFFLGMLSSVMYTFILNAS